MTLKHYVGVIEPEPKNWALGFPAFPGTFTLGDTLGDLLMHARDALASVVGAMEEDGDALPPDATEAPDAFDIDRSLYDDPRLVPVPVEVRGKSVRINVTMDEGLVSRLDRMAEGAGTSRSALLARGARLVLSAAEG
jgi:predicted RNase H-like HicB family nuclease